MYSEIFWSVFSRIRTEYGQILQMQEIIHQKSSEYGHFYGKFQKIAQICTRSVKMKQIISQCSDINFCRQKDMKTAGRKGHLR